MFEVSFGKLFAKHYANFPAKDQDKIDEFIEHYQDHGFVGLTGKNVDSSNVSKDDPDFIKKVKYAIDNSLWHYHIGIPEYELSRCGTYSTSEFVLHYQKISDYEIKLVDFSPHPPFQMPTKNYLD